MAVELGRVLVGGAEEERRLAVGKERGGRVVGVDVLEPVPGEVATELGVRSAADPEWMPRAEDVVPVARDGDLGGSDRAAEPAVPLEYADLPAAAREQRRTREPVDAAADDDDLEIRDPQTLRRDNLDRMTRVAILGAGTIGESLLSGLLSSGWRTPADVVVTGRRDERLAELRERYGVTATLSNTEAVDGAALVVVAVKPQDIEGLLAEIGGALTPEQTVLSVLAAIPTATIERHIEAPVPVVRAMPNAPATVHEGIAGICAGAHAGDEHMQLAEDALKHLGGVVQVPERYMDAVTAVSGSGPAYFALLAEAMIEAGILLGLGRDTSTQLVVQTMLGTAKLLRDEKMHPVELREAVTSPGGTTIAAIRELEQAGVRAAFLNAIQAAMDRSRELAAETS
jgi:pyrroline-5-carboxylate reductase